MAAASTATYDGLQQGACRALAAVIGEEDEHHFLVGSSSVKGDNELHLLEVDDDATSVTCKAVLQHPAEVWSIACCPWDTAVVVTGHSDADSGTSAATVWRMGAEEGGAAEEEGGMELNELAVLRGHKGRVTGLVWDPHAEEASQARLLTLEAPCLRLWDISAALSGGSMAHAPLGKVDVAAGSSAGAVAWDPHTAHEVALAVDDRVLWHDTRSSVKTDGSGTPIRTLSVLSSPPCTVPDGQEPLTVRSTAPRVRCLSYNPNKPRQLLTGSEDGVARIWDVRRLAKGPVKELHAHDHWLTAGAFNTFHDQLVVTAGADGVVATWRVSSTSSAPLMEGAPEEEGEAAPVRSVGDACVASTQAHTDTVTAVAWSRANAWIHGSASYHGRVSFLHVPKEEKYRILMV